MTFEAQRKEYHALTSTNTLRIFCYSQNRHIKYRKYLRIIVVVVETYFDSLQHRSERQIVKCQQRKIIQTHQVHPMGTCIKSHRYRSLIRHRVLEWLRSIHLAVLQVWHEQ